MLRRAAQQREAAQSAVVVLVVVSREGCTQKVKYEQRFQARQMAGDKIFKRGEHIASAKT